MKETETVLDSASRTATATSPADAGELLKYATCPLCHTTDTKVTNLESGGDWLCARCGQTWSATRLATVTAYDRWVSEQTTRRRGDA